jgi:nitronate monooxygenase
MAGGPSTPALAVAVCEAGGLGFLAAGYRSAAELADEIDAIRAATDAPFGVNVFAPPSVRIEPEAYAAYAEALQADAARFGVELGDARFDDDGYEQKLELVARARVPVASFTFGSPRASEVKRLHAAGCSVWVTITDLEEADRAVSAGADALVVQGPEGGGHRGSFADRPEHEVEDIGLLALLRLVARRHAVDLVAAGGIADGAAIAAVLCAGASAAQLGTAFMLTPEAGTSAAHRRALAGDAPTRVTRAFSGRRARGIVNRFMREHHDAAPSGYPELHHLTAPLRAAARAAGDPDGINLWAGQAYSLAGDEPAGELVRRLGADARRALADATQALEARGG